MPTPSSFKDDSATYLKALTTLYPQLEGKAIELQPVSDGIQNYNFFVKEAGEKKYFFSIMRFGQGENVDPAHQKVLLEIQEALVKKELPAPMPVRGKDDALLQILPSVLPSGEKLPDDIAGKFTALTTFIQGKSVGKDAAAADCIAMGELHGQYLKRGAEVLSERKKAGLITPENPISLPELKKLFTSTMESIGTPTDAATKLHAQLKKEDNPIVRSFVTSLQQGWYEKTLAAYDNALQTWDTKQFDNLPKTLLHGDVHLGNVFTKGNPAIYDMGWMGEGTRLFDICQPIVLNCFDSNGALSEPKKNAYLQGISKHITLTAEEKAALPEMIKIVHLRSTATRLTSMLHSDSLSHITKSPVELTDRMEAYSGHLKRESRLQAILMQLAPKASFVDSTATRANNSERVR